MPLMKFHCVSISAHNYHCATYSCTFGSRVWLLDREEGGYLHQMLPMGLGPIQVLCSDHAFFVVMLYFQYCAIWIYIVKYILERSVFMS